MMETVKGKKLQGKHVLYILLGFFGVMVAVNGVFVFFALTSFSGLSVQDSYKRGLNYNIEIKSAEYQSARGWKVDLGVDALGGNRVLISLKLKDKNGKNISRLGAVATLHRPLGAIKDISQTMLKSKGSFETEFEVDTTGQWDLVIEVAGGGYDQPYRLEKRIWVK